MALKGEAKKEYNAAYREAQKNAKAILAAGQPAQKEKGKSGPKPSMPLVDAYPRITPMELKSITDEYNVDDPSVADHIADMVYKHTFNYQAAAGEIARGRSPANIAALAMHWQSHPSIKAAVQRMLKRIGLDDDAKKAFVASLWNDYYNGSPREKALAAKILATAFGFGSKNVADNNKPTELPITDLNKGLNDMGLGDDVMGKQPAAEFSAENLAIMNDEDEEEEK